MLIAKNRLAGRTIVAFFLSVLLCSIIIGVLIIFSPITESWHSHPENIALVIAGAVICFLLSLLVQARFDLRQLRDYFENMAITDPLTNVFNRRYVDENINRLVKSVNRYGGALTLMMVDLDFFRNYNDEYGHGMGDSCLKTIAELLSRNLKRDNDFVARYGGEEFVIVLPSTDEKGAQMIAERILATITDCNIPHAKSGIADHVTVSIGASSGMGNHALTGDDYINKACEALQASKQNGRKMYTLLKM